MTAPRPVFRDAPIAVPAVFPRLLILVCDSSPSRHHTCKSGTMCCSLRKAIFSKYQLSNERIRMGKWRGECWVRAAGGKTPFGVLRHLRPNSRISRLPSKKTDPGNGFDSSMTN